MRVGIIALLHESNTFISRSTTLEHFRGDVLLRGEAVREHYASTHHEVSGFFAGLEREGQEAVPLFAASTAPFGTITAVAFDHLVDEVLGEIDRAGHLDGLLLAPHGAAVSDNHPDADGYWMARVRECVGPAVPIVATLDPHANLSPRMVGACDAAIAYRTNPHVDQRDRGLEAAALVTATLRGEVKPTQAACFPPLAISIDRQCTDEPPCSTLAARFAEVRARPEVLSTSLLLGFPYADVAEMGAAAIIVTNDDPASAERFAAELGCELWDVRGELADEFIGAAGAVTEAMTGDGRVCLLDMGDNVGGGSPGDGTVLLHELHRQRAGPAFVCLFDPEAVQTAEREGEGAVVRLSVGGKTDALHGTPFEAKFEVEKIAAGCFEETEVRHGGATRFDQGRTALLRTDDGVTVMLTSRRVPPFSLRQLTSFGVAPETFRIIVAKGVNAPLAAYRGVCRRFIRVDTPGVTRADLRGLEHLHRRRPMFPFET